MRSSLLNVTVCGECGHVNGDAARFCERCGAVLGVGMGEHRKVVSVLFCDVVGSTALGESTDPEAVREVLARYFDVMNFAPAIKAKSLVAFGFIDTTSPPFGVLAAFNQIQGPKEAVPMPGSDHNNITPQQEGSYFMRSREALESLRKTGSFTPNESWFKP